MSSLESTTLEQQCEALLEPLRARARQGDPTAISPTPEGSAMLAALATQFKDVPLSDKEMDVMYLIPQDEWPQGLAEKVEELLNQVGMV